MKRVLAVLVGAGIAVGGGAAAWAGTTGPGGANRKAAKACLTEARQDLPDAAIDVRRAAVKECLGAAGIEGRTLTPEQQAKRDSLRSCLEGVKANNLGADRATLRTAAAPCLEQAGIDPGRIRAKLAGARECRVEVRAAKPDAKKLEMRRLVKDCVKAR